MAVPVRQYVRAAVRLLVAVLGVTSAACNMDGRLSSSASAPSRRIIVGTPPGGSQDLYARVVARFMGRHLTGTPTVIVENMPGAGGLIASNYLATQAPADGTVMALLPMQAPIAQLVGDPGVVFDLARFGMIGSPSADSSVCVFTSKDGMELSDWREGRVVPRLGVTNYGSSTHVKALLLSAAVGLRFHPVIGYKGTAEIRLAMESGEVDGACVALDAYMATFEPRDRYRVILTAGDVDLEDVGPARSAPALVSSDEGRAWLALLGNLEPLSRFLAVPPGTSADELSELVRAFEATMRDKDFLEAAAAARLQVNPVSAQALKGHLRDLFRISPEARQRLSALVAAPAS